MTDPETSRRQWLGQQYITPSPVTIAALDALVRRGLAEKQPSWISRAIFYAITPAGRAALEGMGG